MRASAMLLAVAVVAVTASVASAAVRAGDADCSAALTPTVTFVTSCSTISATDAACWTPHAPGAADVVLFPSGTAASVPFEDEFTPLSVGSIVVATGAQVTMNGGAFVVSTCLQVAGVLSLFVPEAQLDNGTKSTVPYPADASVPHGTDCSTVSRGFSPRVCGPGAAYVTGSLKLGGLYASLWASTTVASSASLIVDGESFVWGNVSNFGTISANERFYLHGEITNNPGGNVQVTQVRADYWTEVENHTQVPVAITNYGTFTLTISKNLHNNYDIVSTKDFNSTTVVALVIVNHGSLVFNSWLRGGNSVEVWGELALEITNFGTLTWRGNQGFLGLGSLTNYGELVADRSAVDFQNFVSHGGTQTTLNGGSFGFGVSQAIKEKLLIKGVRGPYKSTLVFTNSRFHSRDGSGVFRVHSPLTVVGELMVTPQATLVNEMPFVGAGVVSRGSGVLVVRGVYVAGVKESIMPLSGRVRIAHSGSMEVPEGSEVMLYDGADFHMEAGALLRVSGSVITRKSYVPKMTLHPHAFVVGLEKVSGDFSLEGRLAVLDA